MKRPAYLNELKVLTEEPGIKLITGMRHSGKSVLWSDFAEELRRSGVPSSDIVTIDFDELHYGENLDLAAVNTYLSDCLSGGRDVYLFLDELRTAAEFEAIVGSLYLNRRLHIYIATSWRGLLTDELTTVLSGGYLELRVWPLTLTEAVGVWANETINFSQYDVERLTKTWEERYLMTGGLPESIGLNGRRGRAYLTGALHSVLIKDVLLHHNFRGADFLLKLLGFMYSHGREMLTVERILGDLAAHGKKSHLLTVAKYLTALQEAGLIMCLPRFDIKKERVLRSTNKWYATDLGFRRLILGAPDINDIAMWENLICLELKRRGFTLYIGRWHAQNVCLMARGTRNFYLQLTAVAQVQTAVKMLRAIPDNYPCYILTVDEIEETDAQGINIMSVRKFLWGNFV